LREEVREVVGPAGEGLDDARSVLLESLRTPMADACGGTVLGRALEMNFHTYLPEDLLVKADRNSMAHGLELRSPLLDTELIEFAASLPDSVRNPRMRLKGILKDAFKDLLPAGIRRRPKMGFGIPMPLWLRTHWKPLLQDTILSPDARVGEWLRPEPIQQLAREHWSGTADNAHQLWALLTLELWLMGRERR
jgi:asparagine synthase (glutamine-hydrolysing)